MDEKTDLSTVNADAAESSAPAADFPSEPFQCPACGQLLGPTCRVCVACKRPINPAEICRPRDVARGPDLASSAAPKPEPVRYPWPIFFAVLAFSFLLGLVYATTIYLGLLKEEQAQFIMQGAPVLVGIWVFFDALRRGIPRPLRWALGTMLVLALILPWYLARRRKPQSPVPFVEAEMGPVTRFLLYALLIFFLASLIFYIVKGPQPGVAPARPTKERPGDGNPQPRITRLNRLGHGNLLKPRQRKLLV